MEKENELLIKELMKELNWKERIVIKVFREICIKIYRKGMLDYFNFINKYWHPFDTLNKIFIRQIWQIRLEKINKSRNKKIAKVV